jgi:hypothetical protein
LTENFSLCQACTGFQRKGIKGADLTEEDRHVLIEQGRDPDVIDCARTEIEIEAREIPDLTERLAA